MRQDHTSRQVCAQQWFICSKHKADGNKLKPCETEEKRARLFRKRMVDLKRAAVIGKQE
ncbi:hypothetical protein YC2023_044484 [Brassica napus]